MALANADITERVRFLLQDVIDGAYRWTATELTDWIADGAAEMARLRPECTTGYQTGSTSVSIPTDATTISSAWSNALVNYVCYRACAKDSEDGQSGLAQAYWNQFMMTMGMTGS